MLGRNGRRAAAAAAGVAALVAGLAGCGGSHFVAHPREEVTETTTTVPAPDAALQAVVVRSAGRTAATRTARTAISVTMTGLGEAGGAGTFDLAGTGVVDFSHHTAVLSLSVPLFDRLGDGAGAIEVRLLDRVMYVRLPRAVRDFAGLPASVQWLRRDLAGAPVGDLSALSQSEADPAARLGVLADTSAHVRVAGRETVRGVDCTHYVGTIAGGPDTGPVVLDAWIDAGGLARRVVTTSSLLGHASAGDGALGPDATLRIQGDFYAFGAPVRVAAPAAASVRPYSALGLG